MNDDELRAAIEAVVMVAIEPVTPGLMAELFEEPAERVEIAANRIAQSCEVDRRGFVLARIAGVDSVAQLPPIEEFLPGPDMVGELEDRLRPAVGD